MYNNYKQTQTYIVLHGKSIKIFVNNRTFTFSNYQAAGVIYAFLKGEKERGNLEDSYIPGNFGIVSG